MPPQGRQYGVPGRSMGHTGAERLKQGVAGGLGRCRSGRAGANHATFAALMQAPPNPPEAPHDDVTGLLPHHRRQHVHRRHSVGNVAGRQLSSSRQAPSLRWQEAETARTRRAHRGRLQCGRRDGGHGASHDSTSSTEGRCTTLSLGVFGIARRVTCPVLPATSNLLLVHRQARSCDTSTTRSA